MGTSLHDDTNVGEGGMALSGGQRARVQLARALYDPFSPFRRPQEQSQPHQQPPHQPHQQPPQGNNGNHDTIVVDATGVALLDDPLSALDASVGAAVFERISKRLRERKVATVFVTNDASLLSRCDRVVVMGNGRHEYWGSSSRRRSENGNGSNTSLNSNSSACNRILDVGTYDELVARGYDLRGSSSSSHASSTTTTLLDNGEEDEDVKQMEEQVEEMEVVPTHIQDMEKTVTQTSHANPTPEEKEEDEEEEEEIVTCSTCHADPDDCVKLEHDLELLAERGDPQKITTTTDGKDVEVEIQVENEEEDHVLGHMQQVEKTKEENRSKMDSETESSSVTSPSSSSPSTLISSVQSMKVKSSATLTSSSLTTTPSSTTTPSKAPISADDAISTTAVPRSVYINYLKSIRSPLLIIATLSSFIMANSAQFYQQFTVAKWTEVGIQHTAQSLVYMRSLIFAAILTSVFLWLRSYLLMRMGVRASHKMHSQLLSTVFRQPLSFFDSTPSGQLLSRFGKEMETIDRNVPDGIGSVLFCFLQIFMSSMALAGVITPVMLLPLLCIGYFYRSTMSTFRPPARDLKRCESRTRSPIYTHFGEALRGVETIRSLPQHQGVQRWSNVHRSLQDANLSVFRTIKLLDRWLSVRLETLGNMAVLTAAVASVILSRMGRLKSGSAGWGLTQALSITGLLTWAVRVLTDLESQMMSVIRVTELGGDGVDLGGGVRQHLGKDELELPGEALNEAIANFNSDHIEKSDSDLSSSSSSTSLASPLLSLPNTPNTDEALMKAGWPFLGGISFRNVSMRYNSGSPLILRNITLSVPPGTTLGVVGRTGSGKSSLLLTLFRLVEIENQDGGAIEIDGVDIRSVSLSQLRRSISIIPQDPVLFAGTVLYNLDAAGEDMQKGEKGSYKKKEGDIANHRAIREKRAWEALEAASPQLAQQFRDTGYGLDSYISEGGKNLSLGQRQLFCLARALLRNSKILVLDEATSSVDSGTDANVQETIRREFVNKGVSVITVAHRLDTVLGYDKIAVLGDGNLLEYGSPDELLQRPSGAFTALVRAYQKNKRNTTNNNNTNNVVDGIVVASKKNDLNRHPAGVVVA